MDTFVYLGYIVHCVAFHFIFMVYFMFLNNFLHFVLWYELDDSELVLKVEVNLPPKAHGN